MIPIELTITILILIYSVILHEIAHGFVADKLGDPTARLAKRLTLNPIPHIDPLMTVILPLFFVLSRSPIIFGAAKPVPIDPYNFKDTKKDTALVALAGPLTNIAIAIVLASFVKLADLVIVDDLIRSVLIGSLVSGVGLNIWLALFNLLPIPPLDGSKVLAGLLPDNLAQEIYKLERYGFFLFFAILIFFQRQIFAIIYPIYNSIYSLLLP